MSFTAQDVKALRDSTGAGMMDCKKALEETDGDIEAAKQYLRDKGLAASAKRDDRDNNQGVVALKVDGGVGAIVQLKSETDFVAGSEQFKAEADALVDLVAAKGADAVAERAAELEELKILLKEKIEVGEVSTACSSRSPTAPTSWPTTSPSTSPSRVRSTCVRKMFRSMSSRPSAR